MLATDIATSCLPILDANASDVAVPCTTPVLALLSTAVMTTSVRLVRNSTVTGTALSASWITSAGGREDPSDGTSSNDVGLKTAI